ncbi:MAG: phosphohistidine phosphatase [Bacteroidetes bacterium HGW-Bacteroidetes-9]|nr:MAG: phosphohistidine phosphatase [Bacteroidetes bacterium HGW-Bacteroidetes-9]
MKTLYLMRHAKSSWKHAELSDLERPLLEKGLKRTRLVIEYLQEKNTNIELIITSNAVRAVDTARIIAHAFKVDENNFRIEKGVYMADADSLFDQFFDLPEKVTQVMMIGHNPSITNFVNTFLDEKIDYLPTSGVVAINFDTDHWEELPLASHQLGFIVYPKMFL